MTTVAELGIKVIQEGLQQATERLDGLERQAGETAAAVDRLRAASKAGFAGIERATNQAHEAMRNFASMAGTLVGQLIGSLAGFFSVREYVRLADAWSDLSARVQNAIGPHERAADVMRRLGKMAAISYSDLGITAEAFINNAQSLKELGLNTEQQLKYQEALNNALVVSGARADRAASVQHAFGSALALGALRGDQLNSVLINGDRVAKSLAKELGVTTNELRALGAEGKITREVMLRAMINDFKILQDEAMAMPATIQDGFMLIRNAALQLVGTFDKVNGFSLMVATGLEKVSKGMLWLSDNLEVVNGILAATATIMISRLVPGLFMIWVELVRQTTLVTLYGARWLITLGYMKMSEAAAYALSRALGVLKAALIATGVMALAVAVGWLTTQFSKLAAEVGGWGNAWALVGAVVTEQIDHIKEAMNYLPMVWDAVWLSIKSGLLKVLAEIVSAVVDATHQIESMFIAGIDGVKAVIVSLLPLFAGVMNNMVVMAGRAAAQIAKNFADAFAMANPVSNISKGWGGLKELGARGLSKLRGEEYVAPEPPKSLGDKAYDKITSSLPEMVDLSYNGEQAADTFWNGYEASMERNAGRAKTGQEYVDKMNTTQLDARGQARGQWARVGTVITDIFGNSPALGAVVDLIKGAGNAAEEATPPVTKLGDALDGLGASGGGAGGAGGGGGKKGGGAKGGKSEAQKLLEKQKEAMANLGDELDRYRATVGMTALEEEIWNKQKEIGAQQNPVLAAQVAAMVTEIDRLRERQAAMRQMAQTIESAFGAAFSAIITGSGNARDAIASLLQSLAKMFADAAFQALWNGTPGGGGGIGSWVTRAIAGLAGGLGGGGDVLTNALGAAGAPIGMNANGTPNWTGGLTSINERGGEIVDLPSGSRIYPADVTRRMAERENKSLDGTITLKIEPSGEFRTEMDSRALSAAVTVVSGYNRSKAQNEAIRKTLRKPRSIG